MNSCCGRPYERGAMLDVCVVGGGFSAVPLVRELRRRTGVDFRVVSGEGDTVWDRLSAVGRLDFDLVSSALTSFYSFAPAADGPGDAYPTAAEFHAAQRGWRREFAARILRDVVVRVENFDDHSVVFTRSGLEFKARHVVLCTGFRRPVMADLASIDYSVSNSTFLFDTMGDSANLLISKLVPNNNRIIVRTNGFFPIDKAFALGGGPAPALLALDQLEFHNFRYASHDDYASIIYGGPHADGRNPILLYDRFPAAARRGAPVTTRSFPASGKVVVKYWPVDAYRRRFGGDLEGAVARGYLLNDIALWLDAGRVILAPKDAPVDFDRRTVVCAGVERRFDHYVRGGPEEPRLPPVLIGGVTPWRYRYRDCFMGVVPRRLNNVYLMGYTRPMTGGLANITEMQALFVHKLITRPAFRHRIARGLEGRIAAYDAHYYGDAEPRDHYDHLVHYGFYTDDIARLMGIDHRPDRCRTLRDLVFYYAFPNNAFKYRSTGEYAVDGVPALIRRVNRQYLDFLMMFAYIVAGSRVPPDERPSWLRTARRMFINDMRPKRPHRGFFDRYVQAYRRVTGARVRDAADAEWEAMARRAGADRDRAVRVTRAPERFRFDEDVGREMARLTPLLDVDARALASGSAAGFDGPGRRLLASLLDPPEYDLPYLRP